MRSQRVEADGWTFWVPDPLLLSSGLRTLYSAVKYFWCTCDQKRFILYIANITLYCISKELCRATHRYITTFTKHPDSLRAGRCGDRIPVWARFSAPVQTGPVAHLAYSTMGTWSFPGGKAAGAWRWPPTPHVGRRLKKKYSYISTPLLDLRGMLQGEIHLTKYQRTIGSPLPHL